MRILVVNGSGGDGIIALVESRVEPGADLHIAGRAEHPGRGGAEALPIALRALLRSADWEIGSLGLIAAVVGPGSFTGLRATLALAHGLALGAGLPLQGVSVAEALRHTLRHDDGPEGAGSLWCVMMARRERVFLDRGGDHGPEAFMLDALPLPERPVLLAGDASGPVVARLLQAGCFARRSGVEQADPRSIALVALDRHEGRLPARAVLPLYVDPPEARRPAAGLRPPPS